MVSTATLDPSQRVAAAIGKASRATGVSFDFLLKTAQRESSLDASARSQTSSAAGLFQFVEGTWLAMVKQQGGKYGLAALAAQIEQTPAGYEVRDPVARRQILDLRYDADTSSVLAGELAQKNREALKESFGREPSQGELYIAHFLGASDAARLIGLAAQSPGSAAAAAFPAQAAANRAIFYDQAGTPRSAREVYARLTSQYDAGVAITEAAFASATAKAAPEPPPGPFTRHGGGDAPVFHDLFTSFANRPATNYVGAASGFFAGSGVQPFTLKGTTPAISGLDIRAASGSASTPADPQAGAPSASGRRPVNLLPFAEPPAEPGRVAAKRF